MSHYIKVNDVALPLPQLAPSPCTLAPVAHNISRCIHACCLLLTSDCLFQGTYFLDVHPPLGKLTFALIGQQPKQASSHNDPHAVLTRTNGLLCFVLHATLTKGFFFFFLLPLSRILPNQPATAWAFGYDGKFAFDTIGKGLATMRAHRLATCLPHQSTLSTFCSVLLNQVSLSLHRCMQSIHPTFRLLHFG